VTGIDGTLSALADPTRRGVIELLRRRPCRAGELASELVMSAPAMSRHLRVLRVAGLVEEDHTGEDARVRTYRLKKKPFEELRHWLEEVEVFWNGELASFKRHVERTRGKGKPT
jgi:DNA-binding transcriptional ArsR family regulator